MQEAGPPTSPSGHVSLQPSHLLRGTLALTVPHPSWPLSWLPSPAFSIPFLFFIQLTLPPLEFNSSHLPIILLWLPNSCIISSIYMSVLPWQSLKSVHVALQCEYAFRSPEDLVKNADSASEKLEWSRRIRVSSQWCQNCCFREDTSSINSNSLLHFL